MYLRNVALFVMTTVALAVVGFCGSVGAARAASAPSLSTSQQPTATVVGGAIADTATVTGATGTGFACPTQNLNGTPVGTGRGDQGNTGVVLFCSYPAFATQNPDIYYCTYRDSNGALVSDHDLRACPGAAPHAAGPTPTGNVTFRLYSNATASGPPVYTSTQPLSNGAATSPAYTTTSAGTDYWVATYNGDSNYSAVSSPDAAAPVSIALAGPSIRITAPASGNVDTAISPASILASLSGGFSPSGTATIVIFGPQSAAPGSCATGGLTFATVTVAGNHTYSARTVFTPASAGDYWWYVRYSGDANNKPANSICGAGMTKTVIASTSNSGGTSTGASSGTPVATVVGTPAVGVGVKPAAAPAGDLWIGRRTVTGSVVRLAVSCVGNGSESCSAELVLTLVRNPKRHGPSAVIALGGITVKLRAEQTKFITIALDRTGTELLTHLRKLNVGFVVVQAGKRRRIATVTFTRRTATHAKHNR